MPALANWRTRFAQDGLVKFGQVREGRGRKSSIPDAMIETIVTLTKDSHPQGQTHWSTPTVAEVAGVSKSSVQRVWNESRFPPESVTQPHIRRAYPFRAMSSSAANMVRVGTPVPPLGV